MTKIVQNSHTNISFGKLGLQFPYNINSETKNNTHTQMIAEWGLHMMKQKSIQVLSTVSHLRGFLWILGIATNQDWPNKSPWKVKFRQMTVFALNIHKRKTILQAYLIQLYQYLSADSLNSG